MRALTRPAHPARSRLRAALGRPALRIRAAWQRRLAVAWMLLNRPARALSRWERVHALVPDDPIPLASIAHLVAQSGERARAIGLLRRACALDGARAPLWFNLGFLLQGEGEHAQAITAFDRAIALDERLDRAHYGKALSLMAQGRVRDSIPVLRRNTELQPMSPYGWYQLAHAYHRIGEPERAAGVVRRLAQFEPAISRRLARELGLGEAAT